MLQWDMSKEQVHNVIQYIKTFAPKAWEGKGKKLGEELVVSKDPYGPSHKSFAIQKGKEVYHLVAQCQSSPLSGRPVNRSERPRPVPLPILLRRKLGELPLPLQSIQYLLHDQYHSS